MTPAEETTLAEWKESFYEPAARCLSDLDPQSRAAAVVCIGALPIDSMAAPAVSNVEYPDDGGVRYKALMTFANRPSLLSIDSVLKRLHDPAPGVAELAELILKGRGLTREQTFLGRQMFDPRPEVRASVIPLLKQRTDIDTDVWMLQLSHDADDTVRTKAVEALVDRDTPEVDKRLREMASDTSAAVRAAAAKHVAKAAGESTAALPPARLVEPEPESQLSRTKDRAAETIGGRPFTRRGFARGGADRAAVSGHLDLPPSPFGRGQGWSQPDHRARIVPVEPRSADAAALTPALLPSHRNRCPVRSVEDRLGQRVCRRRRPGPLLVGREIA